MNTQNLTIYGDSIMKGVVLESGRYKIGAKMESFAEKIFPRVFNRSRFGSTIEKGVAMLERDIAKENVPQGVVLLEFGGNDCDFDWKAISEDPEQDRPPKTALTRFKALYRRAIGLVRGAGSVPVVANLPPISAEKYLSWICRDGLSRENILHWLGDENAIYRYQEMYCRTIEEIAQEENVEYVDLRGAFLSDRRLDSYLCDDGIHPNANGQKVIMRAFQEYFEKHVDG
ncbi:MAG: SGNH/GDSL hydrolase family protein [Oscillospiraceae bacterium]|nr:SGNH/GDSL hydrolase family protein [Oscillospiraceae bacterium]